MIIAEKRWRVFAIVIAVLLVAYFIKAGIINGWQMRDDFSNYYVSSRLLFEGKDLSRIYDNNWFQQQIDSYGIHQSGKFLPFPPPTMFLMLPVAPFDPLTAKQIWLVIMLLMIYPLLKVMSRSTKFPIQECSLLLLTTGSGLANSFYLGQPYTLVLLAMFYGYDLIQRNRLVAGGISWGVAASIKYLPVIFLIPYLIKRDKKVPPGFLIGYLATNIVAFAFSGIEVYREYFGIFLRHLNGTIEGHSPFAYQFQSWNAFLRRLFVFDAVDNPAPLVSSPFLFELIRDAIVILVMLIAVKLIYNFRKYPQFPETLFAIIGISFFEILPESSTYTFVMLLFPFIFLYQIIEKNLPGLYPVIALGLFVAIGCLSIVLQKILAPDSCFIFYRLWMMTAFYIFSMYCLFQIHRQNRTAAQS